MNMHIEESNAAALPRILDTWNIPLQRPFLKMPRKGRSQEEKKRENVGILKKTGGGVYPNPTSVFYCF